MRNFATGFWTDALAIFIEHNRVGGKRSSFSPTRFTFAYSFDCADRLHNQIIPLHQKLNFNRKRYGTIRYFIFKRRFKQPKESAS